MAPYLTIRSFQFSFLAAGYCVPAGPYRVLEVVVDTATKPPSIIFLRDVSRLGLPFDPDAPPDETAPNPSDMLTPVAGTPAAADFAMLHEGTKR